MTISTTQDDNGDAVNTPVTNVPMMGEIQGIAHSARCARQLAKTVFLFMAVAWISLPAFRCSCSVLKSYGVMLPHTQTTKVFVF